MLRLIHLSDIHFSNRDVNIGFDPDEDVRREVLRDLGERVRDDGICHAIIVTGDIAYSGKKEEYDDAADWLEKVREISGCSENMIFLCPGNHDVDRDAHHQNDTIRDAHNAINKGRNTNAREVALLRRLGQPEGSRALFAPLNAYNEFAARYQSSYYADDSYVLDRDLPLNDGSRIRIRGMNSALLSYDDDDRNKLLLGSRVWTMNREDGVAYLAMAHHPPSWLFDEHEAEHALNDRAVLQLFGHEHNARVHPNRDWCRIYAGSINPHREEPMWQPGYNIIQMEVGKSQEGNRQLELKIDVRGWQPKPEAKFQTINDRDGNKYHEAQIRLPDWKQPDKAAPPESTAHSEVPAVEKLKLVTEDANMTARSIASKFFRLTLSQRNQILGSLDLFDEQQSHLPDFERHRLALKKAREMGLLQEIDKMIEHKES